MAEITYEMLKPIIKKEEINGMMINLEFQAEGMAAPMQTVATIMPDQAEIMKNATKSAMKGAAVNSAISGAASMLGGGMLGAAANKLGSEAAAKAMGDPMDMLKTEVTDEKKAAAIVQAFANIQQFFKYDEASKTWSGNLGG